MSFEDNLEKIIEKHKNLASRLTENLSGEVYVKLAKEYASINDLVEKINPYIKAKKELINIESEIKTTQDQDYKSMLEEEMYSLKKLIPDLELSVKRALLPKDEADEKGAIIEIRAGTGGDEAALFASVLFEMYMRYAEKRRWKVEILEISDTGIGGYKEASMLVTGQSVFARLKFESGVHRVQRVPETESSGRIHTSAATVAVLPEAQEVDVKIDERDLRIDTLRASGAGGQHVNKTESAIRITHIPSGIVVNQQDDRSQHKNKAKAMTILRSKLYELERQKLQKERSDARKDQVGSGDRSERIRTYNYPQSRVTDHRVNITLYSIDEITKSGELDEIIEALIAQDETNRITNELDNQ